MRKISPISLWLIVFIAINTIDGFGQASQIVGKWEDGNVGLIQYQNQVTGATRNGRSSYFAYKFLANGNYEFVGLMEFNMYNCTTSYFNQVNGKYTIDGATIDLNPTRDFWKSTNSCAASGNKEVTKTPTRTSLEFVRKTDDYGNRLLCLTSSEGETCYKQAKE
jgi:hypothetical protein